MLAIVAHVGSADIANTNAARIYLLPFVRYTQDGGHYDWVGVLVPATIRSFIHRAVGVITNITSRSRQHEEPARILGGPQRIRFRVSHDHSG